jgi:primosomal protein N' (replication factor Y)
MPLHVFQTFTYRLNPEVSAQAGVGARIVVPLGRKLVTGYIVGLTNQLSANLAEIDIKDAHSLVDLEPVCSPEILQLARWVADYYACPLGEVIKATLPPGTTRSVVKPKMRRFVASLASSIKMDQRHCSR